MMSNDKGKYVLGTSGSDKAFHTTDLLRNTACPKCGTKDLRIYYAPSDKDPEGASYDFMDKSKDIFIACMNKCGFTTPVFKTPESGMALVSEIENAVVLGKYIAEGIDVIVIDPTKEYREQGNVAHIGLISCPVVCSSCGKVNLYEKHTTNAKVTYRCQYCGAKN